jgi:hypothetical protein
LDFNNNILYTVLCWSYTTLYNYTPLESIMHTPIMHNAPKRNGPLLPCMARQRSQIWSTRSTSRRTAGSKVVRGHERFLTFIGIAERSAEKPECISMTTGQRATSRRRDGTRQYAHRSPSYPRWSRPARRSSRAGTLPVGECCRSAARLASLPAPASSTQMVSKLPAPSA